jgi:hypothetical protein
MSLGRRIVRENQILIQHLLLDLVIDRVADHQSVVQSERREPFVRWIAPSLEAVTSAEERTGLGRIDSSLFLLWLWFRLGLLIALGNARTGGRRLRGMARGRFSGGRRGPTGRRRTLGRLGHGVPRLLAGEDFAQRLGDSSRGRLADPLDVHRELLAAKLEMDRSTVLSNDLDAALRRKMVAD